MSKILARNLLLRIGAAVFLMIPAIHAAAQGPTDSHADPVVVNVVLKEWMVLVDKSVVRAGPASFRVINQGKENHELVIIKTTIHYKKLPFSDGKVREIEAGELIGEIEEFPPGARRQARFTLVPGDYVLFCNIVEQEEHGELESHYLKGMRFPLRVLE